MVTGLDGEDEATPLKRFEASMAIDYEKWHDGIGYDLDALGAIEGTGRTAPERMLIGRLDAGHLDWRDVEALAALDTPVARAALVGAAERGSAGQRITIGRYAPDVVSERQLVEAIIDELAAAEFYGGLTQALDAAADLHPPEVIDALLRGALHRQGDGPVHFAALLLFLHGKADTTFDDDKRDLYLRFNAADRGERAAAFSEMCQRIGIDPAPYLADRPG